MKPEDKRAQTIADRLAETLVGLKIVKVWAETRPEAELTITMELDNGTEINLESKSLRVGGDLL